MRKLTLVALAALLGVLCGRQTARAQEQARLTADQAIAIARKFAVAAGFSPVGAPTATFSAPTKSMRMPASDFRPRWNVTLPQWGEVEVIDATGEVCAMGKFQPRAMMASLRTTSGTMLSAQAAIERAERYIALAGISRPSLGTPVVAPTGPAPQYVIVTFPRTFDHIPYDAQGVQAAVDSSTGALQALWSNYATPDPTSRAGAVTPAQAVHTAFAELNRRDFTAAVLQSATELVVQPNTCWQPGMETFRTFRQSRIAWVCRFRDTKLHALYDVWVDTGTGEIIGGTATPFSAAANSAVTLPLWILPTPLRFQYTGPRQAANTPPLPFFDTILPQQN